MRMGSRGADDEDGNVVVTEGAAVEEGETLFSSASEHVATEDGPDVNATVTLPSGTDYTAPSSLSEICCDNYTLLGEVSWFDLEAL